MTFSLIDLLRSLNIPILSLHNAPREQGFYLVFDEMGHFVYVGKGELYSRVNSHFDPNNEADYFPDAAWVIWIVTGSEDSALAFEKAVYTTWKSETKIAPKYNVRTPPGAGPPEDWLGAYDWQDLLNEIQKQKYQWYQYKK